MCGGRVQELQLQQYQLEPIPDHLLFLPTRASPECFRCCNRCREDNFQKAVAMLQESEGAAKAKSKVGATSKKQQNLCEAA